jgi:hypothetical protein
MNAYFITSSVNDEAVTMCATAEDVVACVDRINKEFPTYNLDINNFDVRDFGIWVSDDVTITKMDLDKPNLVTATLVEA